MRTPQANRSRPAALAGSPGRSAHAQVPHHPDDGQHAGGLGRPGLAAQREPLLGAGAVAGHAGVELQVHPQAGRAAHDREMGQTGYGDLDPVGSGSGEVRVERVEPAQDPLGEAGVPAARTPRRGW